MDTTCKKRTMKTWLCLFGMAVAVLLFSPQKAFATNIYDGVDGYNTKTAYTGKLSTYVVGEKNQDLETEFKNYKTYIIEHDGTNETRPMLLKKGGLHVTIYGLYESTGDVTIYSDEACANEVAKISLTANSEKTASAQNSYQKTTTLTIPSTGTYYVRFSNTTGKTAYFQFSTQQYDGRNRILGTQKSVSYVDSANGYLYYMVKVKKDGMITLKPEFLTNGYKTVAGNLDMTLLDNSKKAISATASIGTSASDAAAKAIYAVKAGTYYIRVSTDGQRLFTINCKQKAIVDKSGNTKTTAKTLTAGKWAKGMVTWEDTTAAGDYYKFTLKKTAKVTIAVKGNILSGKLNGEVTAASMKGAYRGISVKGAAAGATYRIETKSSGKLPAGTYYIRLAKDTKKTNGSYQVKVTAK